MYNPFTLEGKTILVTGASSGIGAAIAVLCSRMGSNVIITARNKERLGNTFSLLEGNDKKMIIEELSTEENIKRLVEQLPPINGIVHCAGISKMYPVKFVNQNIIDETFKTNFYAPVIIVQQLLKKKKIEKKSSIVFLSSISAFYATLANSVYASSKGAINSFSKTLALELAPQKIRVNTIQPGMVNTNLIKNTSLSEAELIEDEKQYPLGRYGKPEDIANLVIYLLSDASEWMTGSIITIDGGASLR